MAAKLVAMGHDGHLYHAELRWEGSTDAGYEGYDRAHEVRCPPAAAPLHLSSDPAFRGDGQLLDPEQLLLASASSCQLLSFLASAARARVDVRSYADEAEALMPADAQPMRITEITLRPRIVVAAGPTAERVEHLVEVAHRGCFIANTLACEVRVVPEVRFEAG